MTYNDYIQALYRKDNNGKPCFWYAIANGTNTYIIYHGLVNGSTMSTVVHTHRLAVDEIQSKIKEKRKKGYRYLSELKDNVSLPVEGELYNYLVTYLPDNRRSENDYLLPMLAKAYDNENNKLFKKVSYYSGQWKINGLRGSATIYEDTNGLFTERRIRFISREGTVWTTLKTLEQYLLATIPANFQDYMIEAGVSLDGEVYLPGYNVNEINHFVKNANAPENKLLQFWCYDLIVEDCIQHERNDTIFNCLYGNYIDINSKEEHLNNKQQFVVLPSYDIVSDRQAVYYRDRFIDLGFEGLIMRNPHEEYQFGKRNSAMIKYKRHTDGKFMIIDVKPEGIKRPDIPLFICKNDINDAEFEVHLSGTIEYQKSQFTKDNIGKFMFIEYGERSGVNEVPFHVKNVMLI